jgi:sulfur-oxidizing protein SoxY
MRWNLDMQKRLPNNRTIGNRRSILTLSGLLLSFVGIDAKSVVMSSGTLRSTEEMMSEVSGFNGDFQHLKHDRVNLQMTLLADNGNSVPLLVEVASSMTDQEYISDVFLLSQRNPVLVMAHFKFTPASGKACVQTRVRLAGSQKIMAVAKTNNGQWFFDEAQVQVTESACVDAS